MVPWNSSSWFPKNRNRQHKADSCPTAASSSPRQIHTTWQRVQHLYKTSSAIPNMQEHQQPFLHTHALAHTHTHTHTHTWSSDNTSVIIKKGILSLTEDGKPGGTFRTFFGWTSEREIKKRNKTIHEGLTGQEAFISLLKEGSALICLDLIDHPKRKERGHFSHRRRFIYKESFHCKRVSDSESNFPICIKCESLT